MKSFVGWAKDIQIVVEYDNKILLPLLVATFHFVNPTTNGLTKAALVDDDSIFGAVTSNVATLRKLLKNELGLFYHLHVKP